MSRQGGLVEPTVEVRNPARPRELVGTVNLMGAAQARAAIDASAHAFPAWSALPAQDRIAVLSAAVESSSTSFPDLAETLVRENGKVRREAMVDLGGLAGLLKATAMFADTLEARTDETGAHRLAFSRKPHGVALILVPFNAPVALAAAHLMPALVAGNTAVVKVPLLCPLVVTEVLTDLARALPTGVLEVVTCSDEMAAAQLVGDPRVRIVGLTGGVRTAVAVLHSVKDVKEVVFELGGNDAAIVLDDTPITDGLAQRLTAGALSLNGQYCSAVKRLYVHRTRKAELADAMQAAFDRVVVGDGLDEKTTLGPVISAASAERARSLASTAGQDADAVVEAGVVSSQALYDEGYFVRPTLVVGARQDSALVQEEQFAPVLPIVSFDDDESGLAMANDSRYGLGGSVWSGDVERAERIADRMRVGIAIVNGTPFDTKDLRTPFGGVNQSGIGRMLAAAGLEAYTGQFVRVHGDITQAPDVLIGR